MSTVYNSRGDAGPCVRTKCLEMKDLESMRGTENDRDVQARVCAPRDEERVEQWVTEIRD